MFPNNNRPANLRQQQTRRWNLLFLSIFVAAPVGYRIYLLTIDTDITYIDILFSIITIIFFLALYWKMRQRLLRDQEEPNGIGPAAAYAQEQIILRGNNEPLSPDIFSKLIQLTYGEYIQLYSPHHHTLPPHNNTTPKTDQIDTQSISIHIMSNEDSKDEETAGGVEEILKKTAETGESNGCSICLEEYHDSDEVLLLPCSHLYHVPCIRAWFIHHNTCPLCKQSIPSFFVIVPNNPGHSGSNNNNQDTLYSPLTHHPSHQPVDAAYLV